MPTLTIVELPVKSAQASVPVKPLACVHHWLLDELPIDGNYHGVCSKCGAKYKRPAFAEYDRWPSQPAVRRPDETFVEYLYIMSLRMYEGERHIQNRR